MSRTTGRKPGKTVYVLGAGFSAPAAIPTLANFLPSAIAVLGAKHHGLIAKLDRIQSKVRLRAAKGTKYDPNNLEDVFSLADSPHWSRTGDSAILKEVIVRTLAIAHEKRERLLAGGTPAEEVKASLVSPPFLPRGYTIDCAPIGDEYQTCIYVAFLSQVLAGPDNSIITFNYDLVIEQALRHYLVEKKPVEPDYCLKPEPRRPPRNGNARTSIPILKVHGSINWRFDPSGRLLVTPATEFKVPRSPQDFKDVALVPPTWRKGEQGAFDGLMARAVEELRSAERIVIVGYSLPKSDAYFREVLSRALDTPRAPSVEVWDRDEGDTKKPHFEATFGPLARYSGKGLQGLVEPRDVEGPAPITTLEYQPTGIADLDALLPDRTKERGGGFRAPKSGFFAVISGAAGTGKSILTMELACAFASHARTAIYVTQDPYDLVQSRIESFQRFSKEVQISKFGPGSSGLPGHLYVAHLPFEEHRQVEVLNNVFAFAADHPPIHGEHRVLVCLDNFDFVSTDALLKAAFEKWQVTKRSLNRDDKNKQSTFLKLLRERFATKRLNMCFAVEETRPPQDGEAHATPEAFAADVLIRLGVTTHGGYRERFLEIVKAKNQFHYRGKHHFSIVSPEGGGRPRTTPEAYGVVISPSVASQLSMAHMEEGAVGRKPTPLPIRGLLPHPQQLHLRPGSVSVLVSDQGVKATRIAVTLANSIGADARYISLANDEKQLEILNLCTKSSDQARSVRLLHVPPEHISASKLMWDIHTELKGAAVVVLDHVYELQKRYPLVTDPKHFLAALMALFRKLKLVALVVETVDVALGRDPVEKSAAAGLGDNVFVLRRVEFRSRPHMVFSVTKLLTAEEDEKKLVDRIWALEDTGRTLEARETFDTFKNVLSGDPVPVRFALTLYQDESRSPFHAYLKRTAQALKHTFGDSIDIRYYGPDDYARVQTFLSLAKRSHRADCHILAVDEFWLSQLLEEDLLEDITDHVGDMGNRNAYVTGAHDLALLQRRRPGNPRELERWFAVPTRNNVGVLCYDPDLLEALLKLRPQGDPLATSVRGWIKQEGSSFSWRDLTTLREDFSKNAQHFRLQRHGAPRFFTFCRDHLQSCVSFLIELALAESKKRHILRADRDDVTPSDLEFTSEIWTRPLSIFLELLDDDELSDISMRSSRPTPKEPHALFSRQWFSTFGTLRASETQAWARTLEVGPLPTGAFGTPTPVSGAWYLGILKGSISVHAGVQIIRHFTSVENELFKLNNLVGLPIRSPFYSSRPPPPMADAQPAATFPRSNFSVPYAARFFQLAERQGGGDSNELLANYPFYRIRIDHYDHAAAVLWRAVQGLAKDYLAVSQTSRPDHKEQLIEKAIERARNEYVALLNARNEEVPPRRHARAHAL